MKKLYITVCVLMLLSAVSTAVFIIIMPDIIPAHYNIAGECDRFGSKYENLIWPILNIFFGILFLCFAAYSKKKGSAGDERIVLYTAIFITALFILLGSYFMYKAVSYDGMTKLDASTVIRFISIGIGAILIIAGYFMRDAGRNTLFGLRTKWSMASDIVWRKSQSFGGVTAMIVGFAMIISSTFVSAPVSLLIAAIVPLIWIICCIAASYIIYKNIY